MDASPSLVVSLQKVANGLTAALVQISSLLNQEVVLVRSLTALDLRAR